jgi:hypothetical protein
VIYLCDLCGAEEFVQYKRPKKMAMLLPGEGLKKELN